MEITATNGPLWLTKDFTLAVPLQERLDFSCAMFGPNGGLVANAPHIPVHLGAMQEAVQYQVSAFSLSVLYSCVFECSFTVHSMF